MSIALGHGLSYAQNGQVLEGIYRNMYEAQAERARQQQAGYATRVEPVPRATTPYPGQTAPAQTTPSPQPAQTPAAGALSRSSESLPANWFLDTLASIRDNVGRLIPELQRYSVSVPAAREVIGDIYQINADASSLYSRTRNGEPIESIFAAYQQVDVRWRDVSYRLRASGSLDARLASLVSAIDSSFQTIDRRLNLTPPIDRVRLRDLMIVTLTYMDAMFDDIRLSPGAFTQADALIRDGRILRERLRQESYKIDRADYDEVVASYAEFVRQWRTYAARLYALNDAHVNQRLDSIRRQGDEVYASLRIQAATDRRQMQYAGQRLTAALLELQDELVRWGVNRLPSDQVRFVDTVRILVDRSQYLEAELSRGSAIANASSQFAEMDHIWTEGLRSMRAVDARSGLQTSLVKVDVIFAEMRDLLQTGPWQGQSELLSTVASLEAATDDFNNDVQRYKRYLNPVSFRDSLSNVSDELYDISRDLHRTLDERSDMREASRLAQQLVDRWQQLSPMLGELPTRGLSPSRTELLYEDYRLMQPLVAKAASMLLN
ncbi:MAG: hypothetical protein ACO1RT_12165 [Planctomycetaceae bacterium]